MKLVIDASVAVKWLVEEPGSTTAARLLAEPDVLIAPDWIVPEVANALWKKCDRGDIGEQVARDGLAILPAFFQTMHATVDLLPVACDLMFRLRHAPYDCLYLALALEQEAGLVTADSKFHRACIAGGYGDRVRVLDSDG